MKKNCLLSVVIDAPVPEEPLPKSYELLPAHADLGFERQVYAALSQSANAFASFQALKYGHPQELHHYLITPLAMSASHNDAELDATVGAGLSDDEALSMKASLESHLGNAGDHWTLCRDGHYLWSTGRDLGITSMPVEQLHAKSFYGFISQHRECINWHPLFTELQMLLHQHPINLARRQQGLPEVSGVWIWGEAPLVYPAMKPLIVSDDERQRPWAEAREMDFLVLEADVDWARLGKSYREIVVILSRPNETVLQNLKQASKKIPNRWHWQNACYLGRKLPWWRRILM